MEKGPTDGGRMVYLYGEARIAMGVAIRHDYP